MLLSNIGHDATVDEHKHDELQMPARTTGQRFILLHVDTRRQPTRRTMRDGIHAKCSSGFNELMHDASVSGCIMHERLQMRQASSCIPVIVEHHVATRRPGPARRAA